jgi:hypothetical protein
LKLEAGNSATSPFAASVGTGSDAVKGIFNFTQRTGRVRWKGCREFPVMEFVGEILGMEAGRFHRTTRFTFPVAGAPFQVIAQGE